MWYAILVALLAGSVFLNVYFIQERKRKADAFRKIEENLDAENEELEKKIDAGRAEFDRLRADAKAENLDDVAARLDRMGFNRKP